MKCNSSSFHWYVRDEIEFIQGLTPMQIGQYISTLPLRQKWGKLDEEKIKRFLGIEEKID